MTDLVIVNPAGAHGIYGALGDELIAVEPPLWCRLIAGYVRDRGHTVTIIDAEAHRLGAEDAAKCVVEEEPRLVAIAVYGHQPSASTQQMWGAGLFAKAFKELSDVEVIMLGGHVSALPERTLKEEAIDYVAVGEGPATIEGLLANRPHGMIPGLGKLVQGGRGVQINPQGPLLPLKELHGHVWDALPMDAYRAHNWHCFDDLTKRKPYASIYTSLGCPYACSFCCINAPFGGNRYRMRDPNDVVDEIEHLVEDRGITTIKITDEMFVLNEKHYLTICNKLIARGLGRKLNMWAYARVDTVKAPTLDTLLHAGIRWLALGIESASKHVRDGADKRLKQDDIRAVVKRVQNAGINVIGNFMFGLRDDTLDTMRQTANLAIACMPEFANFYSTMAYPGSGLWGQANKNAWTLPENWRGFSQHNADSRPLDTEHVDAATVLAFRDAAFQTYFTHPSYLSLVKNKFGKDALDHVKRMTRYKLKRNLLDEGLAADRTRDRRVLQEQRGGWELRSEGGNWFAYRLCPHHSDVIGPGCRVLERLKDTEGVDLTALARRLAE